MFINQDAIKEYYQIINRRINKPKEGYMERHHIIPKSLGGDDSKSNIVWLTATDHFRCHQLLTSMTDGESKIKMWNGLWRMMNKQSHSQHRDYTFTPEDYEEARLAHSINHSRRMSGENNPFYGRSHREDTKAIMSQRKKGKTYEEIMGAEKAIEMRRRRREEQLGLIKGPQATTTCPHCNKTGGQGIMKRWHFDRCKLA
jgi:hypothetical protein